MYNSINLKVKCLNIDILRKIRKKNIFNYYHLYDYNEI